MSEDFVSDSLELPEVEMQEEPTNPYLAVASDYAYQTAEERGLSVVLPKPTELFIDIDNETDNISFMELFPMFQESNPDARIVRISPSSSGESFHFHVVVDLGFTVDDRDRVLLQAALGSERKRELLAWKRIKNHDPRPTLFFEKPNTGENYGSQRVGAGKESGREGNSDGAQEGSTDAGASSI